LSVAKRLNGLPFTTENSHKLTLYNTGSGSARGKGDLGGVTLVKDSDSRYVTVGHLSASGLRTDSTDFMIGPFLLSISVFMAALWNRTGHYIFAL